MTIRLFAVRMYEKRKFYLYKYERSKKNHAGFSGMLETSSYFKMHKPPIYMFRGKGQEKGHYYAAWPSNGFWITSNYCYQAWHSRQPDRL